jgi:hypothetical protein
MGKKVVTEEAKSDVPASPAKTGDDQHGRDGQGRWRRGVSGNPAGRPAGSRHRVSLVLDEMMEQHAEQVGEAALALALEQNDGPMIRSLLDRLSPPRRGRTLEIELPPLVAAKDSVVAVAAIAQAVARGELTPEEGAALSNVVTNFTRAAEVAEIAARLERIEASLQEKESL